MEKVTGIGCIYLKARDPERLRWWYEKHFGIPPVPRGPAETPWLQEAGPTDIVFSSEKEDHEPGRKPFQMTVFRVRNLDAMMAQLRADGIEVRIRKYDQDAAGRSITIFDPENNAVELWEPRGSREVRVQPATLTDIPRLADMMGESYAEAGVPLDRAQAGAAFGGLLANTTHGAARLVYDEGVLAGYAVLTVRFSMEYGGLDAFIDDLFVRPSHRRRGLARATLKELFAECRRRGALAVHVEVGRDNTAAETLYRACGLAPRTDDRELLTAQITAHTPSTEKPSESAAVAKATRRGRPRGKR